MPNAEIRNPSINNVIKNQYGILHLKPSLNNKTHTAISKLNRNAMIVATSPITILPYVCKFHITALDIDMPYINITETEKYK